MKTFERYLTYWVLACIVAGVLLGRILGPAVATLASWTIYEVNIPIALLVWAMIFPMMAQIDFGAIRDVGKNPRGLGLTLAVNWLIKPFTMAALAWLMFYKFFPDLLDPTRQAGYYAGAVLLGAAPCTAMVFVWSYLAKGDAAYTLVQVAVNDLVILVAFIPIVSLLLGIADVPVPWGTLVFSVGLFVVVPLVAGYLTRTWVLRTRGSAFFEGRLLVALRPFAIGALLTTLVLLFAFQGKTLLANQADILLIALPLTLQTYLIFFVAWFIGRKLGLPHRVCAPAGFIGASNFFELAVAVAIALYGIESPAALATVVGVLIEVPVMLSLVRLAEKWRY